MKVLAEIPHPNIKITIFSWNQKYIVKFETPLLEQTYKVSEMDLTGEEQIEKLISSAFIDKVLERFKLMDKDWEELVEDDL